MKLLRRYVFYWPSPEYEAAYHEQVELIRKMRRGGMRLTALAELFDCSVSAINDRLSKGDRIVIPRGDDETPWPHDDLSDPPFSLDALSPQYERTSSASGPTFREIARLAYGQDINWHCSQLESACGAGVHETISDVLGPRHINRHHWSARQRSRNDSTLRHAFNHQDHWTAADDAMLDQLNPRGIDQVGKAAHLLGRTMFAVIVRRTEHRRARRQMNVG